MAIAHYTVEFTNLFSPIVVTFDDIPSDSPKDARGTAMCMVFDPTKWFISACWLTNENRLTKAAI